MEEKPINQTKTKKTKGKVHSKIKYAIYRQLRKREHNKIRWLKKHQPKNLKSLKELEEKMRRNI
jgi:hypothetical protein